MNTPKVTITGTVNETVTSVTVNGFAAVVNQDNTWSLADLSLVEGENIVTVNALDRAGNTGTATITLVLDTVLPVITVTTPVHNSYVNTQKITVSGSVTEANPDGFWVNDQEQQLTDGGFSIPDFSLTQGINVIRFKAKDKAGNESTASVFVTLDTTSPTVTISTPYEGAIVNTPQIMVSGSVNETVTSVTVNGATASISGSTFNLNHSLNRIRTRLR